MPYANKSRKAEYDNQYAKEHYSRLNLSLLPGDIEYIRTAAKASGLSYSQYVLQAVREKVARDEVKQSE